MGHSKKSCKGKRVADRVIPKGWNKNKVMTCATEDRNKQKRETETCEI